MDRREFTAALLAAGTAGALQAAPATLTETQAATGVRAALERGALAAVDGLGRNDGFLGNPLVRIPLPGPLKDVSRALRFAGMGRQLEELETAMNRAAEAAVPQARLLFVNTVKSISVEDALQVVRGGPTAVTDFFAAKTRAPLGEQFLPIVTQATERVSLAERYNAVVGRAAGLGLLKGEQTNLQQYVTERTLDGLYRMIAEEEKRIRADPVGTGSAILKQVFGR